MPKLTVDDVADELRRMFEIHDNSELQDAMELLFHKVRDQEIDEAAVRTMMEGGFAAMMSTFGQKEFHKRQLARFEALTRQGRKLH